MNKRTIAIARAAGVITATVGLVVGVTFAAFSSTATLSNNTLSTATAGLEIQTATQPFGQNVTGFNLTNLIPGSESTPFLFNIRTTGGVPLAITAHVPATPSFTGFVAGGFSGVHIKITNADSAAVVADTNLGDLLTGEVPLTGTLAGNSQENLKATVLIDSSVVTGTSASVDNFDIIFTGTQPSTS